jgi:hypothetical protein
MADTVVTEVRHLNIPDVRSYRVQIGLNQATDYGRKFTEGYVEGDEVIPVFAYTIGDGLDVEHELERAFRIGNGAPRGDGGFEVELSDAYYEGKNRSLSVGDVVVVDGVSYACQGSGWRRL